MPETTPTTVNEISKDWSVLFFWTESLTSKISSRIEELRSPPNKLINSFLALPSSSEPDFVRLVSAIKFSIE